MALQLTNPRVAAPAVYRPNQPVQPFSPLWSAAPPVYRPDNSITPRKSATPVNSTRIVQRAVKEKQAVEALKEILTKHGQNEWYSTNWPDGVKRVANEVGHLDDTDKDNLKSRLQAHRDIAPLLHGYRMTLETPEKNMMFDSADEVAVFQAVEALTFYHVSKFAQEVRASGLNPAFGGQAGGIADERSAGGQREKNIKGSKGKVFVTRKWSEAKQYAENDTSRIVRVIIPPGALDQGGLQVDPDSMFGLSHTILLKGMDVRSRQLDWWAASYVSEYLRQQGQTSARDNLAVLYSRLVAKGAFLTPIDEAPRTLPEPVTEVMSAETIMAELRKRHFV